VPASAQAATITATTPFQGDIKARDGNTIHLTGQLLSVFSFTANAAGGAAFASTLISQFHIQATTGAQSFDVSQMLHVTALPGRDGHRFRRQLLGELLAV
jgi:hypothetical protein